VKMSPGFNIVPYWREACRFLAGNDVDAMDCINY